MPQSGRRTHAGEFEPEIPGTDHQHWFSRYGLAFKVLEQVRALYPAVLADLDKFPLGRARPESAEGLEWLVAWAGRHGLRSSSTNPLDNLAVRAAVATLRDWHEHPDHRRDRRWTFPRIRDVAVPVSNLPPPRLDPPEPMFETQKQFLARMQRAARTWWAQRVKELVSTGVGSRTAWRDEAHTEWVARALVGGETYADIGRRVGRDASTVRDAVVSLAEFAWWSPPSPGRGRRPRRLSQGKVRSR